MTEPTLRELAEAVRDERKATGRSSAAECALLNRLAASDGHETILAALDAERPQWQPIETAPGGARSVLVWSAFDGVNVAWLFNNTWWTGQDDKRTDLPTPTHWMPLPEPPK